MSVDLSKIKPGDEVLVRFTALSGYGDSINLGFAPNQPAGVTVRAIRIVSHTPKAPAVGDAVEYGTRTGTLIAVRFARAWVEYSDGSYGSPLLAELRRAE